MKTLWDEEELKKYNEQRLEKLKKENELLNEKAKSCKIDFLSIRYGGYPIYHNAIGCLSK